MKRFIIYSFSILFLACSGKQTFGLEATAKTVAESFYQGNEEQLKAHTTPEGYANFKNIMGMFAKSENKDSDFKVIEKSVKDEVAWVKYSTSYDKKPGVFKLVQLDGVWKVTARIPREEMPF